MVKRNFIQSFVCANGNIKRKSVCFGRHTMNDNLRLLFQQTCPSIDVGDNKNVKLEGEELDDNKTRAVDRGKVSTKQPEQHLATENMYTSPGSLDGLMFSFCNCSNHVVI